MLLFGRREYRSLEVLRIFQNASDARSAVPSPS